MFKKVPSVIVIILLIFARAILVAMQMDVFHASFNIVQDLGDINLTPMDLHVTESMIVLPSHQQTSNFRYNVTRFFIGSFISTNNIIYF